MNEQRFVVDTNTLVSAVLMAGSVPDQAVRRARTLGTLLISPETLDELAEVLSREKFDRYVSWEKRQEFLEAMADQSVVVDPVERIQASRDTGDNMFLDVAVEGKALAIITGDGDLLELHPYRGIAIVKPASFIERQWG
ncbi:MAG: putative toxin-antitoxin system toxin component, PIN family [Bacteroidota bacterium]